MATKARTNQRGGKQQNSSSKSGQNNRNNNRSNNRNNNRSNQRRNNSPGNGVTSNDRNNGHGDGSSQASGGTAEQTKVTEVVVEEFITVRELAELMDRSPIDLIKVLMNYGIMAPITHNIDHETAVILGDELKVKVKWPEVAQPEGRESNSSEAEAEAHKNRTLSQRILAKEDEKNLSLRPPVVAVLGHVDHGKTTLLDRIRNTSVVDQEAGGITQRTGAYQVDIDGQIITFLDTPGHEAFTAMRSRGAQVTDIVVLVVAADDGVMPQTKEAISHAQAAGVTIIVALNKVDRPNANPDRVMEELSKEGLQPETWGGETIVVPVSALQGTGIDDLLENILIVAELEEYKANPKGDCVGSVIESELDRYRGVTATLLVQNGLLKQGDTIVVGTTWGRIKAMFDHSGKAVKQAGLSMPVSILGLQEVPKAGDIFQRVSGDREARRIAEYRKEEQSKSNQENSRPQMSLHDLFARFEGGDTKTLHLIVRADMQGTLEPIVQSLEELSNDEIKVKILQAAIGNISESDVMLAEASDAVIIGFSINVDRAAQVRAEASKVEIRHYDIIYKMLEDIEAAMTGMLDPIFEDVTIGHAKVLQLFKLKRGIIAGSTVTDGNIKRNASARLFRDGKLILEQSQVITLKRFTEDVNEVRTGFECGIGLSGVEKNIKEDDIIEIYEKRQVR